jgi:putative ABC transport system permease protein
MHPLNRKLLRDLWHVHGLVVAVALVIGAGIATFVMSVTNLIALEETRDVYYERYRFADVFATAKRAPERLVPRLADIPGIRDVDTRIVENVTLDMPDFDEPVVGRLVSIPESGRIALNDVLIRQGRRVARGRPDEAVVSEAFAEAHSLKPGDNIHATINGKRRQLDIVGIALSPEYVYSIAPGAMMPDNRRYGVIWMGREALAAAFDMDGAFNDLTVSLLRNARPESVIQEVDTLLAPYGGTGAYARKDQVSNWFLSSDIEQLHTMATLMPSIFLSVSAFLLNMVVSRLIATEREQIGLLKAFGYSDAAIGWHYVKFVLAMVAFGVLLGCGGGAWLGNAMLKLYTQFYRFPYLYFRLDAIVFVGAVGISLVAALIGSFSAVRRATTLPPAQAMAPPAPTSYHGSFMQRLPFLGVLDQPTRMVLRHILRWPWRAGLSVLGIAMAFSVLLSSMYWIDAIERIITVQYSLAQRDDMRITLTDPQSTRILHEVERLPGVLAVEPYRSVPVRFRFGHRERREALTGLRPDPDLNRVLDTDNLPVELPQDGILMADKLASLLGAKPGDTVTVEVLEGRRPVREIQVAATFNTYLGTPAYMRLDALNRLMNEAPSVSGAYILADSSRESALNATLKDMPKVAGVALRAAVIQAFRDTLGETMYIMVGFYIMFSCLLAFGVVYNSVRISLSERGRELASLRVLGLTRFEISYILLGELAAVTFLALPVGCILGYGLCGFMTSIFETELYRIPFYIERDSFGISAAVIVGAVVVSGLIVRRRIDTLDLIAVLKTRE